MPKEYTASSIYVFLGGTRSGKSSCAEQKVLEIAQGSVLYVATAHALSHDVAMQERILRHRQRRPADWELLECPQKLAQSLRLWLHMQGAYAAVPTILVDCVTLWVSNMLGSLEERDFGMLEDMIRKEMTEVLALSHEFPSQWVFVSGETGLGGIGSSALERAFHDGLGLANQLLVAHSTEAFFTIAARTLKL